MQYGEPVNRAFAIAWRFKYLWLLAVLGGADVGAGGYSFNLSLNNVFASPSGGGEPAPVQYLQDHPGLIVVGVVLALVFAVAWLLLSTVTTGALVRAGAEHDAERPFGLALAWRAGLATFWPVLGLRLLALLYSLLAVALIGALIALGIVTGVANQFTALAVVIVVGVLIVLALIPVSIVVGLVLTLAVRALVLEQRGVGAALGRA